MLQYNTSCVCAKCGLQVKIHFCVDVCIRIRRHPPWPSRPHAHILRLLSCFCAHFACYHLECALFAYIQANDIKSLDGAVQHNECAIFATRTMCIECAPIPPLCSATYTTRTFCVSIPCAHIACSFYAAHIAPHCSLYIFCTPIVKIYQKSQHPQHRTLNTQLLRNPQLVHINNMP